jgi:hypothetical protein
MESYILDSAQGGKGDVSAELAKLNHGIVSPSTFSRTWLSYPTIQEDVTKQIRQEITTSYPLLLTHLSSSLSLSSQLAPIQTSLTSLSSSLDRLQAKIHIPYENLSLLVRRLTLAATASDLTRRAARFVLLSRRLESQMARVQEIKAEAGEGERERELAKAALSVAELDSLLKGPIPGDMDGPVNYEIIPLDTLDFVKAYIPSVDRARDTIIQEMETMVVNGLADLNQPLLSSSLQTAHNLRLLPDLVSNLLADLNDAVTLRIQRAFDSAAIGREVAGKGEWFSLAPGPFLILHRYKLI